MGSYKQFSGFAWLAAHVGQWFVYIEEGDALMTSLIGGCRGNAGMSMSDLFTIYLFINECCICNLNILQLI